MKNRSQHHFHRAAICYKRSDFATAVQNFLVGLEIEPNNPAALADLAKAYEMLSQWDLALSAIEKSLTIRPNYPTALRRKNRILDQKHFFSNRPKLTDPKPIENSPPFDLHFDPKISQNYRDPLRDLIAIATSEISQKFNFRPKKKIDIFLRPDLNSDPLPNWAEASYDGAIHIQRRIDRETDLFPIEILIRHEWTHFVVDQLTDDRCPNWLDESLALVISRPLFDSERQQLRSNFVFTPIELSRPFSSFPPSDRRIAYFQSHAIGEFLIHNFGFEKIRSVLDLIRSGESTEIALRKITRRTVNQIFISAQKAVVSD